MICVSGSCQAISTCTSPRLQCGASCIDPRTDGANCGSCGNRCVNGQTCSNGTCSGGFSVGSPCTTEAQCPSGFACGASSAGWPSGYCSRACTQNSDCGSNGTCVNLGDETSPVLRCLRNCTPSGLMGDCRPGYICIALQGAGAAGGCFPSCIGNISGFCESPSTCSSDGLCR